MSPQTQASSRQVDGPLLKVTDLRTAFRTDRGLVKSVDGVSFTLDRGKSLGIVGESGSGKTVLSRSIMGLLTARNVERDRETDTHLAELGWRVVRIWEHENLECAADRVEAAVRSGPTRS